MSAAHLHSLLGRLLLHRGALDEALFHATQARESTRTIFADVGGAIMAGFLPILHLTGDVLEALDRLEEAREVDREAMEITLSVSGVSRFNLGSAERRAIQELTRQGRYEVRGGVSLAYAYLTLVRKLVDEKQGQKLHSSGKGASVVVSSL